MVKNEMVATYLFFWLWCFGVQRLKEHWHDNDVWPFHCMSLSCQRSSKHWTLHVIVIYKNSLPKFLQGVLGIKKEEEERSSVQEYQYCAVLLTSCETRWWTFNLGFHCDFKFLSLLRCIFQYSNYNPNAFLAVHVYFDFFLA